jgi:Flp pilus assembly protein TadD
VLQSDVGWTLYLTRQTAKAESQLKQTLSLDPAFNETLYDLGITFIQAGRFAEAISALEKAKSQFASHQILGALGYAYGKAGRQRDARELLASLTSASRERYISPASLAVINIGLGDADQAFSWLDRGVEARDPFLLLLDVDSIFDPLRSDPRFTDLRQRVLFPKT